MLIKWTAKAIAKVICRHLTPSSRATIVRDSVPMRDLADNLPRHLLTELLFESAQKLALLALRVQGQYGAIEGSPYDRVIFQRYALTGTWSPKFQTEIIDRAFRSKAGTFVDVGANIGLTSIPAARNHPINCFALEPDPVNFGFLERNIHLNGLEGKIKAYEVAAYDAETQLDFELSPDNWGDHRVRAYERKSLVAPQQEEEKRKVIEVPALPLDSILANETITHPLVVKIDTQGSEPIVFRGARELLKRVDLLTVEFSPYTLARLGFDDAEFFRDLRSFACGHIVSLDHDGTGSTDILGPPLELDDIIARCHAIALNKHPDNYFDLVLLKERDFISAVSGS